ncbi:MAG TPA: ABC transporter substrate-binding protein, partial [Candidatus Polarisedimenticolaceae bacterium]|nr:ABC transporter substrate-binding protein [Candidatus Polarisedimenticolaceae bacterium]
MKAKMITLGAVLWLSGSIFFPDSSTAAAADTIKVQLDWILEGKHVPFFVARERGFFKKNNLEATLLEGKGSANSATFVDAGQADYSYGDLLTAVQ